jgi:hypothetical protein
MAYKMAYFLTTIKVHKNDLFLTLGNQRLFCPIVTLAPLEVSRRKYSFVVMFVTL